MASFLADHLDDLELEDVACLLGVSERMIRNYIKEKSLPCSGDGAGRRFSWQLIRKWDIAYQAEIRGNRGSGATEILPPASARPAETPAQVALRKLRGEADLIDLKLARERGEVVAIADARNAMARVASSLRTAILSMPAKMTGQLFGVKERARIQAILQREADSWCRRLMALKPDRSSDEAEDE